MRRCSQRKAIIGDESSAERAQGRWWARRLLSQEETNALLAEGRVVMLTDQYAPVERLLAPMFVDRAPK